MSDEDGDEEVKVPEAWRRRAKYRREDPEGMSDVIKQMAQNSGIEAHTRRLCEWCAQTKTDLSPPVDSAGAVRHRELMADCDDALRFAERVDYYLGCDNAHMAVSFACLMGASFSRAVERKRNERQSVTGAKSLLGSQIANQGRQDATRRQHEEWQRKADEVLQGGSGFIESQGCEANSQRTWGQRRIYYEENQKKYVVAGRCYVNTCLDCHSTYLLVEPSYGNYCRPVLEAVPYFPRRCAVLDLPVTNF